MRWWTRRAPQTCVHAPGGHADSTSFARSQEGVRETAVICGAQQCVMLPGIAHDVMLDARWEDAAAALAGWLDSLLPLSA